MAKVHLVIGPVGSGKSTFARKLEQDCGAIRFSLDEWFSSLFSPDRPETDHLKWYVERTTRLVDQMWEMSNSALKNGIDVVLEIGLIRREQRESFYGKVDSGAHDLTVHWLDAPRAVRRERVLRRNEEQGETFSMVVPIEFFEIASDLWEPPDELEQADRHLCIVKTA